MSRPFFFVRKSGLLRSLAGRAMMQIEQIELENHFIRYLCQGSAHLVVTFEGGAGSGMRPDGARRGFAEVLLRKAGYDLLLIMPKKLDWYQTRELGQFFKNFADLGIFGLYQHVSTYGNSMGGFAALCYAHAVQATHVIASAPRSTLQHQVLPWPSVASAALEYPRLGPYRDAVRGLFPHMHIDVLFDPLLQRDAQHARRIAGAVPQTRLLRVPFGGHEVLKLLANMGMASTTVLDLLAGQFQPKRFYADLRSRRTDPRYLDYMQRALSQRAARRQAKV